jgi:hypothetical protein
MKKSLTSGCSFTSGQWEEVLNNHFQHYDMACPAAGNKYIADSVIHKVNQDNYDVVLVMWSGLTRLDVPVTDITYFNNYFSKSNESLSAGTRYIMSGGAVGGWTENPMAKLLFENTYKFTHYQDLALLSILEMLKLQNFLKAKNIRYYFMSYMNYWNQPKEWLSGNLDQGLNNYPALNDLLREIDWSNWIFLNNNKDSVYELALQNNDFCDDNFHPGTSTQKQWGEIVLDRLRASRLVDYADTFITDV